MYGRVPGNSAEGSPAGQCLDRHGRPSPVSHAAILPCMHAQPAQATPRRDTAAPAPRRNCQPEFIATDPSCLPRFFFSSFVLRSATLTLDTALNSGGPSRARTDRPWAVAPKNRVWLAGTIMHACIHPSAHSPVVLRREQPRHLRATK